MGEGLQKRASKICLYAFLLCFYESDKHSGRGASKPPNLFPRYYRGKLVLLLEIPETKSANHMANYNNFKLFIYNSKHFFFLFFCMALVQTSYSKDDT